MNYELIAIGLGIWNIWLQLRLKSKNRQAQRLMYSLDKIAHKEWRIVETKGGFDILDREGDTAISIADKGKKHG